MQEQTYLVQNNRGYDRVTHKSDCSGCTACNVLVPTTGTILYYIILYYISLNVANELVGNE